MLSAPGKWKQKNCRKFEANLGCAQQDLALSPAPQKQRERKKEEKKRRREGRREEGKKGGIIVTQHIGSRGRVCMRPFLRKKQRKKNRERE